MKDILLFRTKEEYERFVLTRAFRAPLLAEHPFYRNLISWVVDNRTPLFFSQSDPSEHDAFSLYWHAILLRDTYADDLRASMYMLHEFTHSLFAYPHDLPAVGEAGFRAACLEAEYAASNETEVLAHWRVSGLRHTFLVGQRIWYDILRDGGMAARPPVPELLHLRREAMEGHVPGRTDDDAAVLDMMKGYETLNARWAANHWPLWRALPRPEPREWPALEPEAYEAAVAGYRRRGGQAEYEANVLANVRTFFALHGMAGRAPATFSECFDRIGLLDGHVLPSRPYRA